MSKLENLKYYLGTDLLLWYPEKLPFSEFLDTKKEAHTVKMGIVTMQACIVGCGSKPVFKPISDLFFNCGDFDNGEKPIEYLEQLFATGTDAEREFISFMDTVDFEEEKLKYAPFTIIQELALLHFDIFGMIKDKIAMDYNCL